MKDKISGAILLKGACNNGIYTFPESIVASKKVANVQEQTSIDGWHKRLGHPSIKIVHHLVKKFSLPISSTKTLSSLCHSCSINKAHQQPFRVNSLQSHEPLELIYTDVWGPASYTGIDGSRYYLIFVDHYTKYIWFYPMVTKYGVSKIFPHFKRFVEARFQKSIKTLYSDNGGEFIALLLLPTHRNKMVSLNVVIVISLKQAIHFFMMPILISLIGLMPFKQLPTS